MTRTYYMFYLMLASKNIVKGTPLILFIVNTIISNFMCVELDPVNWVVQFNHHCKIHIIR